MRYDEILARFPKKMCPAHEDKKASLSVRRGDNGGIVIHCHAGCEPEAIVAAVGLTMRDLMPDSGGGGKAIIADTYDYHDADGTLLYQVVRYDPKDFRQRRSDGRGGWEWNMKGVKRIPFRLPELLAANPETPVYIVEGEKDVRRLTELDYLATTNPGGAGKWPADFAQYVRGRRVIIIPDNDEPGRKHAADVAGKVRDVAASVQILDLPGPLPEKGDFSDWISTPGNSVEQFDRLASDAPEWTDPTALRSITAGALEALVIKPRELILEPFLGDGEQPLLSGQRGSGKTWVAMGISMALAGGGAFLKWHARRPVTALYVDGEMMSRRLQERTRVLRRSTGLDPGDRLHFLTPDLIGRSINLRLPADRTAVEREAARVGAQFIVFDNIASLFPTGESKTNANLPEWWEPFQAWQIQFRRNGVATMPVIHMGKNEGAGIRGTSAMEDIVETSIQVTAVKARRATDGAWFTVKFTKNRDYLGPGGEEFEVRLEGDAWTFPASGDDDARDAAREAAILLTLSEHPAGLSQRGLREALQKAHRGMGFGKVPRILSALVVAGRVQFREGFYAVPA